MRSVEPLGPVQRMLLECRDLDVGLERRSVVRALNLTVKSHDMLVILGPNGSGKSLSLHTFAGLRAPQAGWVAIAERRVADWPRRALARQLALLPQQVEDPFPATVLDTVLLGRHPHIGRWQWESAGDIAAARSAIAALGLEGCEGREIGTLSGGERRRAALAAIIAQDPGLFLLDEPTNQLDPGHQLELMELLRRRADAGAAVVLALHDPNLAARFADHVLLLGQSGEWCCGTVTETLTADRLTRLYATRFEMVTVAGRRIFYQG